MEKPATFKKAAMLVYASLAVGLVKASMYEFLTSTKMLSDPNNLMIGLLTIGIIGFLGYQAGEAKNWARITFLVMFILGAFMMPSMVMNEFNTVPIIGMVTLIQSALQIYALYILFSGESKIWFKEQKQLAKEQGA